MRPNWTETFLDVAEVMSRRATCPRLKTGAVITSPDHRILATGYNGAPTNSPHCLDAGCLMEGGHCTRAVHAELNALLFAAKRGIAIGGAWLYVLHAPCVRCAICIAQAGLVNVCYRYDYGSEDGVLRLRDMGVDVFHWEGDPTRAKIKQLFSVEGSHESS
jgi:dCMP deaminase